MQIDIKASQLLNSRLFHDLLGPITAINNGIEFVAEPGNDADAVNLLKYSADRLRRRINFFRGAFGLGGGKKDEFSLMEAGILVDGWFADSKSTLKWPGDETLATMGIVDTSPVKLLMILSMLAEESLPRGGEVSVQVKLLSEGLGLMVSAFGHGARCPDGVEQAIASSCRLEDLSARNIVSYVGACIANSLGARIEAGQSEGQVDYASLIPINQTR